MAYRKYLNKLMSYPHRGLGTIYEHKAARYICNQYLSLGLKAERQKFVTIYNGQWYFHLVYLVVFIASLVMLYTGHTAIAAVIYVLGFMIIFEWPFSLKPLYKKIFPVYSENVLAKLETKGAAKTLVISAHYDTPRTTSGIWIMKVFSLMIGPQLKDKHDEDLDIPIPPPFKSPLFVIYAAVCLELIAFALKMMGSPLFIFVLTLSAILLILLFIFIAANSFAPYVPGALDNGASVAITMGLADYFSKHRLRHFNLVFLNTGSEENVEKGMDNYVKMNKPSKRDTHFINLDTVGEKNLIALYGEVDDVGIPNHYAEKEFKEVIALIHSDPEFAKIKTGFAPAASDSSSLSREGYHVITSLLSVGNDGYNRNYHQKSDTLSRIDHDTLKLAEDFVIHLVETLDQ